MASVKPPPSPFSPKLAGIGMHHKSPGCCSCDWIIYSSSLRFLTRKYHTKGKVMKSHLSPHVPHSLRTAGLSRSPCGRRRVRGRPSPPTPACLPPVSHSTSSPLSHAPAPVSLSLTHAFPHRRSCLFSLPLSALPAQALPLPPTPPPDTHTSLAFSFCHAISLHDSPPWRVCLLFFALSMKMPAH